MVNCLSPIKTTFSSHPFRNISLDADLVEILKVEQGLLVMAYGKNVVVKWFKDSKSNELKIHCDDLGKLPSVLPILYGMKGTFSLHNLFNQHPLDQEVSVFQGIREKINGTKRQIINESFMLADPTRDPSELEQETVIYFPRMDGDLTEFIPQLLFHGCDQLIEKIMQFVHNAVQDFAGRGVAHGDLRTRNVFFKLLNDNTVRIYIADIGNAKRIPANQAIDLGFFAFQREVQSMRPARKEGDWKNREIKWKKLQLVNISPALQTGRMNLSPSFEEEYEHAYKRKKAIEG